MARARSAGAAALSHGGPGPPKLGLVRRLGLPRSPAGCRGGFPASLWLPGSRNVHLNVARLPHFCPEPSPGNPRFQGKRRRKQHTRRGTPRHSRKGYGTGPGVLARRPLPRASCATGPPPIATPAPRDEPMGALELRAWPITALSALEPHSQFHCCSSSSPEPQFQTGSPRLPTCFRQRLVSK